MNIFVRASTKLWQSLNPKNCSPDTAVALTTYFVTTIKIFFSQTLVNSRRSLVQRSCERLPVLLPAPSSVQRAPGPEFVQIHRNRVFSVRLEIPPFHVAQPRELAFSIHFENVNEPWSIELAQIRIRFDINGQCVNRSFKFHLWNSNGLVLQKWRFLNLKNGRLQGNAPLYIDDPHRNRCQAGFWHVNFDPWLSRLAGVAQESQNRVGISECPIHCCPTTTLKKRSRASTSRPWRLVPGTRLLNTR